MIKIKNTMETYGWFAILFHWVMALLVIFMLCLGLYMASLPDHDPAKFKLISVHKEIGFTILILVILRSLWILNNIKPRLDQLPAWEKWSALIVHGLLYVFMFLLPITGWLMSSAAGHGISFYGWFTIPSILPKNEMLSDLFFDIHSSLAFIFIGLITLHVLAAMKHLIIDKDTIFQRICSPID